MKTFYVGMIDELGEEFSTYLRARDVEHACEIARDEYTESTVIAADESYTYKLPGTE